jgi:diaminohydroxyphosphoribosylaminopyrimidine deaminase/5-amino-6-(5-phosphoribosylamino)uracil reductase
MTGDEKYMFRCIELARLGAGSVSPNPMVGCAIVSGDKIIGEGYHELYGGPHAEVNAINSVSDQELLKTSRLFVSLEPCSHFGKTPPCSDLIISKQIPEVIIGTIDSFSEVAGRGTEKLRKAGINVKIGSLEPECRELNKRFFTFHEKKRPYIILKWAETLDGFIDEHRENDRLGEPNWITGIDSRRLVHKFRSEEDAVMVGTNTAEKDNPSLKVYLCKGRNPVRVVIDRNLRLPLSLQLFDNSTKTIVFNSHKDYTDSLTEYARIDFDRDIIPQVLNQLYQRDIQSVVIEGGRQLLESFIVSGIWDEAHQFVGNKYFCNGIKAPEISGTTVSEIFIGKDRFRILKNLNL